MRHRVFCEDDLKGRATSLATELVEGDQRKLFEGLPVYRGIAQLIEQQPEKAAGRWFKSIRPRQPL